MHNVVALSDFHCHPLTDILKDTEADLLLVAGDLTHTGQTHEWLSVIEEFSKIKKNFKHICVVFGNHDFHGDWAKPYFKEIGVHVLENELIELDGLRIYGSPITPRYGNWAYMYERGEDIARYWANIPENLDFLLVHGPAYGTLDIVKSGYGDHTYWENVGCWDLKKRIEEVKPRNFLFGHLHYSGGQKKVEGGTVYRNCAIFNEPWDGYEPTNQPHVFYYDKSDDDLIQEIERVKFLLSHDTDYGDGDMELYEKLLMRLARFQPSPSKLNAAGILKANPAEKVAKYIKELEIND